MSTQRMHWMDLLRGSAVLLIIVWHATLLPAITGGTMPVAAEAFNNALSPYRVPLLLVMSGMLLQRSLSKGLARYVAGKARHILWPLVVWTAIYVLVSQDAPKWQDPWYWTRDLYLWYLVTILVAYGVGFFMKWVHPALVLLGLLVLNEWFVSTNSYRRVIWYVCFFMIGAVLDRLVPRWQKASSWWAAALAIFALAWGIFVAYHYRYAPTSEAVYLIASIPGVLVALWAAPRIPRHRFVRWVETAGENSLVVYVTHFPAMLLTQRFLDALAVKNAWLSFPLLLVAGLGAAWIAWSFRAQHEWLYTAPRLRSDKLLFRRSDDHS